MAAGARNRRAARRFHCRRPTLLDGLVVRGHVQQHQGYPLCGGDGLGALLRLSADCRPAPAPTAPRAVVRHHPRVDGRYPRRRLFHPLLFFRRCCGLPGGDRQTAGLASGRARLAKHGVWITAGGPAGLRNHGGLLALVGDVAAQPAAGGCTAHQLLDSHRARQRVLSCHRVALRLSAGLRRHQNSRDYVGRPRRSRGLGCLRRCSTAVDAGLASHPAGHRHSVVSCPAFRLFRRDAALPL